MRSSDTSKETNRKWIVHQAHIHGDLSAENSLFLESIFGDDKSPLAADETNYYVLATDCFQYAIIWACENLEDDQSREFAWFMSRTPLLPEAYRERVETYKDRFFDRHFLRSTEQADAM